MLNKNGYHLNDFIDYKSTKLSDRERLLAFDLPRNKTEKIISNNQPISASLKERAPERRRKMKGFNYKFETSAITLKQNNYSEYIDYIKERFRNNEMEAFEYKIVLKFLLTFLQTENPEIIKNSSSDFKQRLKALISEVQGLGD